MHWTIQLLIGTGMIGVSVSMMLFEYARNRSGHRLFKSEAVAMLYWLTYLSLVVLGASVATAAVVYK
jgi:hypothetical protein